MKFGSLIAAIFAITLAAPIVVAQPAQDQGAQPGDSLFGQDVQQQEQGQAGAMEGQQEQGQADPMGQQQGQPGEAFQGKVLAIESDSLTLQDLSTGLTTTYTVNDSAILEGLQPGDEVSVQTDTQDPQQATDVQSQAQDQGGALDPAQMP